MWDTCSVHCSLNCPRAEMPNFWKIFPNKSICMVAGTCQLLSLLWTGFLNLPVTSLLLIGSVWAGHAFTKSCSACHLYFWYWIPSKVNLGPNFWLQDLGRSKKAVFCFCNTHLGFCPGFPSLLWTFYLFK